MEMDRYFQVQYFRSSGRWGAWVREPKYGGRWLYIGSYLTDRLAARCQDRALLKLESDPSMHLPIKLNFNREDYKEDEHLRSTLSVEAFFSGLKEESRVSYFHRRLTTPCLRKFLAEEQPFENLPNFINVGELTRTENPAGKFTIG